MHKHIDKIVDVFSDSNYEFLVYFLIGKQEENHPLVSHNLIKELTSHN